MVGMADLKVCSYDDRAAPACEGCSVRLSPRIRAKRAWRDGVPSWVRGVQLSPGRWEWAGGWLGQILRSRDREVTRAGRLDSTRRQGRQALRMTLEGWLRRMASRGDVRGVGAGVTGRPDRSLLR